MNVALIEPVGGHGGMNYYDFGLARGLSAAHCKVVVYTSEETRVPDGLPFVVNKSFKGIWGSAPKLLRAIRFSFCLLSTLKDAKAIGLDIAHYHFFHYTALEALCVKAASMYGFDVVVTAHDVESFSGERDTKKARKVLSSADKVIAHNEISKQELVDKIGIPSRLVGVVPHGNYIDYIKGGEDKVAARKAIGLSSHDRVILFFGQIKKVKGLDILLQSLPRVIKQYPDLKLVIAGKVWKDDFSKYDDLIKKHGLASNVVSHIHYIPDDDVANYYRAADLVVLPYRKIYQSGVLLMAMSYSVPVLASDIPGMTEIIVDDKTGYIFKSEDVEGLSTKLIQVLSNMDDLRKTGKAGFETVSSSYDWNVIGRKTHEVYEAIRSGH